MDVPTAPDWMADAACSSIGYGFADEFFPEKGGSTKTAKRVCAGCPVSAQCLAFALNEGMTEGVWGGLSPRERREIEAAPTARERLRRGTRWAS